ncbi:adhesion G-protein coupled receptor G4-like isoform X2 [Apostichopus japonicus]|uniref:adhesion G-protein coupled receptor G4-like isoform X2 n=1 Tax=Stichopus japonicus TaxID=307972 RepID=UPI003AB88419
MAYYMQSLINMVPSIWAHSCPVQSFLKQNFLEMVTAAPPKSLECYSCNGVDDCSLPLDEMNTNTCSEGAKCTDVNIIADLGPGLDVLENVFRGCLVSIEEDNCVNSSVFLNNYFSNFVPNFTQLILDSEGFACFCGTNLCNEQLTTVSFNTNQCYSDPCMNGGTCIDSINMFLCTCPLGFVGDFCENNTNECYSDPCMNGGTCIDSINMFLCTCPLLYVGVYCENDKPAEEKQQILSRIADDTGVTNKTDEEIIMSADAVQEATSDGKFLAEDPMRIEITVSALESIVEEGISSIEVTEPVIKAVNNLIEVDGDVQDNVMDVGGRIVAALEKQVSNFQKNEGNFSQLHENIGVVSINVVPSNVGENLNFAHVIEGGSTRTLTGGLTGGKNEIYGDGRDVPLEQVITSISVPSEVLELLDGVDGKVPISFIIYKSDTLFTPSKPTMKKVLSGDDDGDEYSNSSISERIDSQIITTIIVTGDKDDDKANGDIFDIALEYPIISKFFTMENLDEGEEKLDSTCVVWSYNEDTDKGFWSDKGCDMLQDDSDLTVCSCKHIGSFAVLIRVGPIENQIALYYITLIGSIISGVCLIFCIVTFLSIKAFRSKQPTQIHINLCLSLLGFYIAFLVGPLAVGKKQRCAAVSAIIQFFCLATLAWMSAEALNLYFLFLKAKKGSIRYFTPIACIVAYGSSFTCVILVAFLDKTTDYETANYCFIHPGYSLYFGFLAEVGAMFVFNLIIFAMVIRKILCRPLMVSKAKEHAKRDEIITRIRHGVLFWFVLGLSWAFGFLAAVDQSTLIFDYLYCIFIALQGVLMFLLLCVANPEFRKMFLKLKRSEISQSNSTGTASLKGRSTVLKSHSTEKSISESNQSNGFQK